jgi:alpha-methylacyl-CoA racemase
MGPLEGVRIVELAGIGPGPMACMLLADMGADVIKVDRLADAGLGVAMPNKYQLLHRSRKSVAVDLKNPAGVEAVLKLVESADALIEGFRPGVTERMGLGPEDCWARNPKLVYGRMTGWGQEGTLSHAAGHDMNYIALIGALHAIGRKGEAPVPPLNLVGDFGGGALYMVVGVLAALLEAGRSGKGQVVDTAMTDGAASLMTIFYGMLGAGQWQDERGSNVLDTGSHFYDVYETSDGKHVSIASIEAKFYAEMLEKTGLDKEDLPAQWDAKHWPEVNARMKEVFKTKTRDQWCEIMEGSDVCFAPVLNLTEAPDHAHNQARQTFVEIDGVVQPNVAPRFSRTESAIQSPPAAPGEHTEEALREWGFDDASLDSLREAGAIGDMQQAAE